MKLSANIEIDGQTTSDLLIAIDEVKKKIEDGFTSGAENNQTGGYDFTVKEKEQNGDCVAPYKTYLYVYDCKTGEKFFRELKGDDIFDIEAQVLNWIEEQFCGELKLDYPMLDLMEGDYYAQIKTDWTPPDSVFCWESKGFYLK